MNDHVDLEVTPRANQLPVIVDDAHRTPYIPRRKSSASNRPSGGYRESRTAIRLEQAENPTGGWLKRPDSIRRSDLAKRESESSKRSLPKVGLLNEAYHAALTQPHQALTHHGHASVSSSDFKSRRRLFSKIVSSFTNNNGSAQTIPALTRSLGAGQAQPARFSGSTAMNSSSRTSSMVSTESMGTSLVRTGRSRTHSEDMPSSPNPLCVPPQCHFLGQPDGEQALYPEQRITSGFSQPDEIPPPALATAVLHALPDKVKTDLERMVSIWIAVDVECDIHYAEDPASSPRSKALGPPHTDPGFLTKLSLNVSVASGCRLVRLVGLSTRDLLLPGERWSVVVQVVADPPLGRKSPVKAFSLQNRPSSHTLMDQLHTMLSPSRPSSQDILDINLTFDHILLPSTVQCCVSNKVVLQRIGAWTLDSRRRQYLQHRHSPQPNAAAATADRGLDPDQRQRRDDVACKLLDALELNHQLNLNPSSSSSSGGITPHSSEAVEEILEDFFRHFDGSPRLHQRARQLLKTLDATSCPVSCVVAASPSKPHRRNAMELSRENLQLQDITNQWPGRSPTAGDVGVKRGRGGGDTPPPLFSPRKRASNAELWHGPAMAKSGGATSRNTCPGAVGLDGGIGNPRFYEDELDEASRIWRGMRDSSAGSTTNAYLTANEGGEYGDGDGMDEEEENGRRGVLGAPWL